MYGGTSDNVPAVVSWHVIESFSLISQTLLTEMDRCEELTELLSLKK
jgi:hypothetical protein